jgi:hypothetical protein
MDSNAPRVHRQQALAAYVEPLASGRRVAVVGDASLSLGARIAELGARSVQLWDPDAERARREAERAPRGVLVRPLPQSRPFPGDGNGPRGAFDLVVIPNLEIFDDAVDLLAWVRGLVGEDGAVLVCAPNRDGDDDSAAFDYYELFDLVASQFVDVTMIAQLPFQGVALAELVEGDSESPAVTVDTQLAGSSRTPEAFLALGSQHGLRLDPYAIVELPDGPSPADERESAADAEEEEEEEEEALRRTLAQAEVRAAGLEEQLADERARLAVLELAAAAATGLEQALRERALRTSELESALADRSREVLELAREVHRLSATAQVERALAGQLDEVMVRAERAERALAAFEAEQARAAEAHAAELARYEEVLRDRAKATRALETELVRRERIVRELIDAIDEAGHPIAVPRPQQESHLDPPQSGFLLDGEASPNSPRDREASPNRAPNKEEAPDNTALLEANAQLRQKLDALALDLARREGEAQATAWTIAELERRLETEAAGKPPGEPRAPEPGSGADDSEVKRLLASALDELDVLRRALAQEHEARIQAESARAPFQEPPQD